jgi:phage tail sheath gpL-like
MATGSVSFDQVSSNIRVPGFYGEVSNSAAGYYSQNLVALIIGQPTTAGLSVVPELVTTPEAATERYGAGSMLARMISAFRKNNEDTELWAVPLTDAAGTAATHTMTITGTASAAGTIFLYIGGELIQVPVASSDTATAIGDAVVSTVNANVLLPCTAANASGVVTFTAKNKGTIGNLINYQVNFRSELGGEKLPAGISVVFAVDEAGATDPTLATATAALGDLDFEYIIHPYTDTTSLNTMRDFLSLRWSPNKMLYGHSFTAAQGTSSQLYTLGDNRNDEHQTIFGAYGSPTWSPEIAAGAGGVAAKYLNIDPARTLQTLPVVNVVVPKKSNWFTQSELNTLLFNGITPLNYTGGIARIVRCITTYQVNSYGMADPSYLDVTTMSTNSAIMRECKTMILQKFPRSKLAADDTAFGVGQAIVTPKIIRGELIALYDDFIFRGLVQNKGDFVEKLIVTLSPTDPNRVDVLLPPTLINNLVVTALRNEFKLRIGN